MPGFCIDAFIRTYSQDLHPSFRKHMKNIYSCIALASLVAAFGTFLHFFVTVGRYFSLFLVGMRFMVSAMGIFDEQESTVIRLGCFLTFDLVFGLALGPILETTISTTPEAISSAFFAASLLFICLTVASPFNNHRQNVYLVALLLHILSQVVFLFHLAVPNGSPYFWYKSQIYCGLIILSACSSYNTKMFMDEYHSGDEDYVFHAAHLFMRFIGIFQCLLVMLIDKAKIEQKMTLRHSK